MIDKGAVISNDKKYRYKLWRIWDENKPIILWIMLNPSTADADKDDPTIRRCINFSKSWGYGGIYVGNLYAFRATYPQDLYKEENREGRDNRSFLGQMYCKSEIAICAWGNREPIPQHIKILGPLYYLELSTKGIPKHPLYLKSTLKPKKLEY